MVSAGDVDGVGAHATAQGSEADRAGVGAAVFEAAFVEQVVTAGFVLHGAGYRAYECAYARSAHFLLRCAQKKMGRCCAWGYSTGPATGDRGILVAKLGQSFSVIPRQQAGILEAASKGPSLRSG